jgi:hypothetical protein
METADGSIDVAVIIEVDASAETGRVAMLDNEALNIVGDVNVRELDEGVLERRVVWSDGERRYIDVDDDAAFGLGEDFRRQRRELSLE